MATTMTATIAVIKADVSSCTSGPVAILFCQVLQFDVNVIKRICERNPLDP